MSRQPLDRENAWPEWLKLQPGLTPIYTPAPRSRFRSAAILGRSEGQPYLTFKIFKRHGRSWKPTRYIATLTLCEFRDLCVKLNDLLQRRPELGEDRPFGRQP